VAALHDAVLAGYPDRTGLTPMVFVVSAAAGAGRVLEAVGGHRGATG
jgi:hypothetical protein